MDASRAFDAEGLVGLNLDVYLAMDPACLDRCRKLDQFRYRSGGKILPLSRQGNLLGGPQPLPLSIESTARRKLAGNVKLGAAGSR